MRFKEFFKKALLPGNKSKTNRILITGIGKSGSTALFHAILSSMPGETVSLFEPENSHQTLSPDTPPPVLVKSFIPYSENFSFFEKKVLITRDPRDNLISLLLYKPYNIISRGFPGEKDKACQLADSYLKLVKQKEAFPGSISVVDLMNHLEISPENRMDLQMNYYDKHPDVFPFKYEDFIDQNLGVLERYLQFKIKTDVEIPEKFQRVSRSKNYDNWKSWFTMGDVEYFKPLMQDYLEKFNYSDDWALIEKPFLDPRIGSEYIEKIVKEAMEVRIKKKLG